MVCREFDKLDFFLLLYYIAVDGWTARRFNQVSKFGAWFDVIIDNIGRGILWTRNSSVKIKNSFFPYSIKKTNS